MVYYLSSLVSWQYPVWLCRGQQPSCLRLSKLNKIEYIGFLKTWNFLTKTERYANKNTYSIARWVSSTFQLVFKWIISQPVNSEWCEELCRFPGAVSRVSSFFTSYNNPILWLLNVGSRTIQFIKSIEWNAYQTLRFKEELKRRPFYTKQYFVVFKILTITCKALNRMAPSYICDLLQVYHPNRNLRSASRGLSLVEPDHQTQA